MEEKIEIELPAQMDMNTLGNLAIGLVIVGAVVMVGLNINSNLGDSFDAGTAEANASLEVQEGLTTISGYLPLVAVVAVATFLIFLIRFLGASTQ